MRTKSRLLFMGGLAVATIDISSDWDAPACYIPTNKSWAELHKGKKSKRDRRK